MPDSDLRAHDWFHLATNSVRFAHCVFARMLRTCDSTVRSDSTSRAAICRLDSVVVLAESMDVFDVASQAIMSTELLPGEDPEFLGGPDRISFYRLVHADLPVIEGSPA